MVPVVIPVWLQLLIYALAVVRVTGLIVADAITADLRDRALEWLDDRPATLGSYVSILITCFWCTSMWVGAVAAPLIWFWGDNPVMLCLGLVLAFSQLAGMLSDTGR